MTKRLLGMGLLVVTICFSLAGCQSSDYKEALELKDAGDYTSALAIFETISDYKDSADQIKTCESMIDTIHSFTVAIARVDDQNSELDTAIVSAESVISTGEVALDDTLVPALETAISEAKSVKYNAPDMLSMEDEILQQIVELEAINYDDAIWNVNNRRFKLEESIKQYSLVNAPEENYIISCLMDVENVIDISAVTEDNDPNGNLNKVGGYTSTVYFSSDLVDQSQVYGATLIDKGTTAGGGIEVYATSEDAQKRNDYLSIFDGGIFASGSHTVIGTVVVRTSDKLTASDQNKLETAIIDRLILIVDEENTAFGGDIEEWRVESDRDAYEIRDEILEFQTDFICFATEYSIFLRTFVNSSDQVSMYEDLVDFEEQMNTYTEKMAELEATDMTDAELKLYLATTEQGANMIMAAMGITEEDLEIQEGIDEGAANAIRPEFKEAMESYEVFFDNYIAFMIKFNEATDTSTLVQDYMDYMTQYTETMDKLSAIQDEELSNEELTLYTETMTRISQKLLTVAS